MIPVFSPRPLAGVCLLALPFLAACGSASSSSGAPSDDAGASVNADGGTSTDASGDASANRGDSGGGSKDGGGGGPVPPGTNAVTISVEPGVGITPVVDSINAAKTSVHMTMYLLSSSAVINALIAAHNAGRDVKVLLNQNFTTSGASNASSYSQLQGAGVNVQWAPSGFTLTHEKCVIVDNTSAWIMTMNATQSSPSSNREYLAYDTDPSDVAEAEQVFEADFANLSTTPSGNLLVAPNNARPKLVALIESAKSTLVMEAEELSDSAIVTALATASDRGVQAHVVLASTAPSSNQQTAIATLKQHNVKLVSLSTPYIHAKSIAVDGAQAYVGSENFSAGSLGYNRELGVIVNAASEVAKVISTSNADFAAGTAL